MRDDERAFRAAVAAGDSPEAAAKRLKTPKRLVKYFTRLVQPKPVVNRTRKPVAVTAVAAQKTEPKKEPKK